MSSIFKKCITGLAAFATLATVAAPAEASHRWRDRDDDDAFWAIGAGILGLGIGPALASSSRGRYYDRYYDPYYRDRYYDYGYSHRPYYRHRYRYGYRDCYTRRVWDPYWGRMVRVRHCTRW